MESSYLNSYHLLTLLLIFCVTTAYAQVPCSQYSRLIQEAQTLIKKQKYLDALRKYNSAKTECPQKQKEVEKNIEQLFEKIDGLRTQAQNAERKVSETLSEVEKQKLKLQNQALHSFMLLQASKTRDWIRYEKAVKNTDAAQLLVILLDSLKQIGKDPPPSLVTAIYQVQEAIDKSGKINSRFIGQGESIYSIAFSPDGTKVLTGGDSKATLWDLQGNPLQEFMGYSRSVAFSPDGMKVLTVGDKATLWDLQGNSLQEFFYGNSVAFSPDGMKVLIGGNATTLWDLSGNQLQKFKGHTHSVNSIAFSPDGTKVLTGSSDKIAILWDLNGNQLQKFEGHKYAIDAVAFSPDGTKILMAGGYLETSEISLCGLNGHQLQKFEGHTSYINSVTFSPDGTKVLTGSNDRTAILWDLNGNQLQKFEGHTSDVTSVAFSPDGNKVLTGSYDETTILYALKVNKTPKFDDFDRRPSATFSPDRTSILMTNGNMYRDEAAILWSLDGGIIKEFKGNHNETTSVSFSPSGQNILTGHKQGEVVLWDLNGNEIQNFYADYDYVRSLSFSSNENMILISGWRAGAHLCNLEGKLLQRFVGAISSAVFSPDESKVLTGGGHEEHGEATLWDLKGNRLHEFGKLMNEVTSVAFSPDGKKVLIGGSEGYLYSGLVVLWDVEGNSLHEFRDGMNAVECVAFSPDGKKVLIGGSQGTEKTGLATLWDLQGNYLQGFRGHTSRISSVAFSPNGEKILTGSYGATPILWDTSEGIFKKWKSDTLAPILPETLASIDLLPSASQVLRKGTVEQYWHALYHYEKGNYNEAKLLFKNLWSVNYYFSEEMIKSFHKCLEISLKKENNEEESKLLEELEKSYEE
jgi:WD40 repeat protein